jgi:hypothetical protein
MQAILEHIERKKDELAAAPLFRLLEDRTVDPRVRLSFAPCLIPWVMGFADLNRYVFRDETSEDPLQRVINAHTRVDDDHWTMFVEDLRALGALEAKDDMRSVLRLLWGNESRECRQLVYGLIRLFSVASPRLRLVILESVEAAGAISFRKATETAKEFQEQTGKRLLYFGEAHEALESGHLMGTENVESKLSAITLSADERAEAAVLVDRVFAMFRAMFDGLLRYARDVGYAKIP